MTQRQEFLRVCTYLGRDLGEVLRRLPEDQASDIHEIRLRVEKPVTVFTGQANRYLNRGSTLSDAPSSMNYLLSPQELQECFRLICEYSIHSFQEEIRQGFVTIVGGHRVGLCGTSILEAGQVVGIKDISSLNVRIARQVMGVADQLLEQVFFDGLHSTLIIGSVGSGKTTLLRDAVRQIGNGHLLRLNASEPIKLAVLDERGELAATHQGVPQHDVGRHTDVYHLFPKAIALSMALRTLSPQVVACDEIGREDDILALLESLHTGVKILATAHGTSLQEVLNRGKIADFVRQGGFERFVTLEGHHAPTAIRSVEHWQEDQS